MGITSSTGTFKKPRNSAQPAYMGIGRSEGIVPGKTASSYRKNASPQSHLSGMNGEETKQGKKLGPGDMGK